MRRYTYPAILGLLALASCELVSCAVYRVFAGRGFRYAEVARRKAEARAGRAAEPGAPEAATRQEVLHPYLGYVYEPAQMAAHGKPHRYGFIDLDPAFTAPKEAVVVGIFGGSVAWQVADRGAAVIVEELGRVPAFAGRPILIANAAVGAYKQPQMLYAYHFLTMLGARFDVVLLLDGFNDLVVPASDNLAAHVFFAYPQSWSQRTAPLSDVRVLRESGTVMVLRDLRGDLAAAMSGPVLDRLVTANVIWHLLDARLAAKLFAHQLALREEEGRTYLREGPLEPLSREVCFRRSADVWARSSVAMDALAERAGARYFHFLQPNQYVPGSKTLTDEERARAIDMSAKSYGPTASAGYPVFIAAGRDLPGQGVAYHDLTMTFAAERATLYADTCCHLNQAGVELLARRMAGVVGDALGR